MYEDGVVNWEKILTILIGIVIVASIYLILYRRKKSKSKRIQQENEHLKMDRKIHYKKKTTLD